MEEASTSENDGVPEYVVSHLSTILGSEVVESANFVELKSAQQRVWIVDQVQKPSSKMGSGEWERALHVGRNKLVLRLWKASSCWWNLNRCNQNQVAELARSEVAGYRIAHRALSIHIPFVLYFSHDNNANDKSEKDEHPWAILSYVGPDSLLFHENWQMDTTWMDGMVKTRLEFGFDEPHPRWGRVPENQCCDYTLSILNQVTLPLHKYMQQHCTELQQDLDALRKPASNHSDGTVVGFTYSSMMALYQQEHVKMVQTTSATTNTGDPNLLAAIDVLGKAIHQLKTEKPRPLPMVLCHMDCQPQNIIFAQQTDTTRANSNNHPRISSVLDWEEAALADPRFELLLLCRKVCANRTQAEQIWKAYQTESSSFELGPLAPWLALETVHSITSLLLQSMDLLGGGRTPWETKPDLWGKIQREIKRLVLEQGWDFCNVPEFQ
ncbi:expressed unknown protein [Seminavis robusta]|uniref:Aminoglycoside phosphotransferase domain-containing protein n=1 Tax=Seminavis robusta TaxID=568900 RepID=A0A9N8DIM6_9STRA|nr:expressed unknown protein [Seminavis robusta]|eukprot:Sro173_g076290.1 n/a (439) ;mRNA; r:39681-40997